MRNNFYILTIIMLLFVACNNSNSNETNAKELDLQKRELDLKQKELELKEKELSQNSTITQTPTEPATQEAKTIVPAHEDKSIDFEKHNDIKIFLDDLAKAIAASDIESISEMVAYPFQDVWGDNAMNKSSSLSCKNKSQFTNKYSGIFSSAVVAAIKKKKYRGRVKDRWGDDVIVEGEYLFESIPNNTENSTRADNVLVFGKVGGKFKLKYVTFFP